MTGASKLITIIMFWFILGVVWASLYDFINTTIPTANPVAITNSGTTWTTLLWVWNIGIVVLAVGGAFCLINDGNIGAIISLDCVVLSAWIVILLLWAYLYTPVNITIPTGFGTTTNQYLTFWDNGALFLMGSFGLISVLGVGSLSFGGRGRPRQRIIRESRNIFVNEPRYATKTLYRYPKKAQLGKP